MSHQNQQTNASNLLTIGLAWLFPNRAKSGPIDARAISKQLTDRQKIPEAIIRKRANAAACQSLTLPNGKWTPHDLRRTGATLMVANGVLPEIAERCLNHTEGNALRRIYQVHQYQKEMQSAWTLLGEVLSRIRNQTKTTPSDQDHRAGSI